MTIEPIGYYDRFLSMDQPELEENYNDLCDMVDAIENGDDEMARKLAQQHAKRFNQYMKKREREEENA